ncbi:MAG: hypothetical protein WAK21_09215, partial [Candidatus Sulfotelmatobacter sp.]
RICDGSVTHKCGQFNRCATILADTANNYTSSKRKRFSIPNNSRAARDNCQGDMEFTAFYNAARSFTGATTISQCKRM